MTEATSRFLEEQEALYEQRKNEILSAEDQITIAGTTYYVSADGDDNNDGKTPETAWRTLDRVNGSWLLPGDGVRFRRGDLFRGGIKASEKEGLTFAAYGTGPKPKFYGWDEDLASPCLWEEIDAEHHIWKYIKPIQDPGTLVFNEGEKVSRKLIPTFRDMKFVCRDNEGKDFVMTAEMTENLDIFWHFDSILTTEPSKGENFPIPVCGEEYLGELYLRCDKGNPGIIFSSIEAIARRVIVRASLSKNITVDNLCMKYACFGVAAGGSTGLHVSNCEIGWIGGNIQNYAGTDPNYPQGRRGSVTRYGNGVEIYGSCDDYIVDNCYIYQCYDAAITHQVNTRKKCILKDVRYTNNLIDTCVYGIEYFLDQLDGESESCMENIEMCGNIIRLSGYGWGQQRHNTDTPALIKGWSYTNTAKNFTIHHNVFDRCAYRMLHLVAKKQESCPDMHDNIYIQHLGGKIGQYGANEIEEPENLSFDEKAEQKITEVFGDKNAQVYWIR